MLLAALLLLAQDPTIDTVRTLTAGQARAGCWLPLAVTVNAPGGFNGDVAVASGYVEVLRALTLAAGEKRTLVVPALPLDPSQPLEVRLRAGGAIRARHAVREQIGFATGNARIVIDAPPGWSELDPAMFEAVDEVRGASWTAPPFRIGAVAPAVAPLLEEQPWLRTQRDAAILFVILYAFAVLVVLWGALTRRTGAVGMIAGVSAVSVVSLGAFFALFPRGDAAVRAWSVNAAGLEARLHVARGDGVTYARLAKPIVESWDLRAPIEVRLGGETRIEGCRAALTLQPAASSATASRPAPADDAAARFFVAALEGRTVERLDGGDEPVDGVSAPGLVEARLVARYAARR